MSVITMEKLTVLTLRKDTDTLMRRLMRLRAVAIDRKAGTPQEPGIQSYADSTPNEAAARVARIEQILPTLTKRSKRKKPLFGDAPSLSFDEFCASARKERAERAVETAHELTARAAELRAKDAALADECAALLPYLDLVYPLDFMETEATVHLLGVLPPSTTVEMVEQAVQGLAFDADIVSADKAGMYLSALCHKKDEVAALRALAALGFNAAHFKQIDGTPKELFDRTAAAREALAKEAERIEHHLDVLAENLTDIEILYDVARTDLLAEQNKSRLLATGECTVFSMWCPTCAKSKVTALLDRCSAAYEFEAPDEGDDVPVLLQNNPYARNFEWVLGMYSYPKYGKFDPTFIMSIFYFIIFGLMFADAGYGLVLSLACFIIVAKCKPREGMKRFLLMFGYCGISCMIFGVLFGAYFGNFPLAFMENVLKLPPERMPRLGLVPSLEANVAVLFDPLQDPMSFLLISLGIGALHLIAGMAVKAVLLFREGKPLAAVFDIFTYWLLFAGIGALFLNKQLGMILTIAGVVSIVLTQGRDKKGVMKLFGGLLGLYDLVGFASDLLSYSRILALGLAAGVIGQVVNILATMKGASFVGFIMMLLVFCIGHLLNLVINVLGTFVHTSRLQYIEFFGKFYEDGGTPFTPMVTSDRFAHDSTPATDEAPQK